MPRLIDADALVQELQSHGTLSELPVFLVKTAPTCTTPDPLRHEIELRISNIEGQIAHFEESKAKGSTFDCDDAIKRRNENMEFLRSILALEATQIQMIP